MKEKLIIKNFGPIKSVELELGRFNVLIGDQGTGKSTVAKLLTAIQSTFFREIFSIPLDEEMDRKTQLFFEYLKWFEIQTYNYDNTEIIYWNQLYFFEFKNKVVEIKEYRSSSDEENSSFNINYIIAERVLVHAFENSLYALIETGTSLSKLFLRFGDKFQKARKEQQIFDYSNVIGVKYTHKDNKDFIILPSGKEISINDASTGIQGTVSLLTVFDSITGSNGSKRSYIHSIDKLLNYLIIEEPELNCFPDTQYKLIKYFACQLLYEYNGKEFYKNRILITTHSPYILASLNNLMEAFKTAKIDSEETNKIIEKKYWINPDDVCSYMMLPNGYCEDIFDREEGLIKSEKIDSVSRILNGQFDAFLNLEFSNNEVNT